MKRVLRQSLGCTVDRIDVLLADLKIETERVAHFNWRRS